MTARLLMIGLDGADSNLLDRWSLDGTLPHIGALRARGSAHHLQAPHGVTDDALWANVQYASGLGEHGRFSYMQRLENGRMGMAFRDEAGLERFWDRLSKAGQRVAIFDLPKSPPPRPLNGIHLSDWLVHGKYFAKPKSHPENLADEIVSRFGAAPKSWCSYVQSRDEPHRHEVLANLLQSVDMKQAAGEHYLNQEAWDLFFIGLKEAHCAGHHFWDLSDPTHPDYNAALSGRLGEPLRTIFQRIDQAVGRLVEAAGPEARVLLLATTKMEPNASISHLHKRLGRRLNRAHAENALTQAIRRARRALPPIEILPYNENGTAIRINREGARRDRLLADVERSLLELTDANTGQLLAERAYRPSADYPGRRAKQLPDLLVRYRAGHTPRAITTPRLGRIEAPAPEYRAGNHACGPFVIGAGLEIGGIGSLEDIGAAVTAALAR